MCKGCLAPCAAGVRTNWKEAEMREIALRKGTYEHACEHGVVIAHVSFDITVDELVRRLEPAVRFIESKEVRA